MNPEEMQGEQMTADEAKASLGIATNLQEQMLVAQAPEASQTPETDPGQAQTEETGQAPQKDLGGQIKAAIDEQLTPLKEEIQKALTDEEPKGGDDIGELKKMFGEFMKESQKRDKDMEAFKKEMKDALK